jgi:predicted MFS family arabinose efflux permease
MTLPGASGRPALIALLCVMVGASTFSMGGFAPLLPEIGRALRLSDVGLGALAGMLGFARMAADLPVGLLLRRHLRPALILAPLIVIMGIACLSGSTSLAGLLLGRALMGLGHALGMVGALTVLLRAQPGRRLGAALNSIELSGMLGLLGGVTVVGWLPHGIPWNNALLIAGSPLLVTLAVLPVLLASTRQTHGLPPVGREIPARGEPALTHPWLVPLAFITGATVSCTYSTIEQFLIPLRGSRHFGLDRAGIARLLQIGQLCDIVALIPVGLLSDRLGAARVLSAVVFVMAAGITLIAFGGLIPAAIGCALLGLAMAGWMLPLGVLRGATAPERIAWRTAVYRVGVDGGIFLGPFLSGLVAGWSPRLMPALLALVLLAIGVATAFANRPSAPEPAPSPRQ